MNPAEFVASGMQIVGTLQQSLSKGTIRLAEDHDDKGTRDKVLGRTT
jgi:hypothetical protein